MTKETYVIREFREDHRKVRDGLLDLIDAIQGSEISKAGQLLDSIGKLVGPHFRFEEETLYPTMRQFLGDYVDELLTEHDDVIETARTAAKLLEKDSMTDTEAESAITATRSLLVHVSNCDGLAILSERLHEEDLARLNDAFDETRAAAVPLFEWADTLRMK